jgi:hypothetical protein
MNRLFIATRGIDSWRQRLASPDRHWRREYSAFETAVSWEYASRSDDGLPEPIGNLFAPTIYGPALLIQAVAEHKVTLPGGNACSQCDVWAILATPQGKLSLSVEAKAAEPFGDDALGNWLVAGNSDQSRQNRKQRWEYIQSHLPEGDFTNVRYQLLHRCAASVIEAKRLGLQHAAFVVQSFGAPKPSFNEFGIFCAAIGLQADRGKLATTDDAIEGGTIKLSLGWVDCPLATDQQVSAVV